MRKYLLLAFLVLGYSAHAQTDSVRTVVVALPDSLLKTATDTAAKVVCTDTIRLGNFYAGAFAGTRLTMTRGYSNFQSQNELLTDWGKNVGLSFGYKTRNGRFLLETGYYHRTLSDINRLQFDKLMTVITSGNMSQIPVLLKVQIWQNQTRKFKVRAIAGVNYTSVSDDYSVEGNFKLMSMNGNVFRIRSFDYYHENEPLEFEITRNVNTSKSGTSKHLTAEGGLEGSYQLTKRIELGSVLTYQYASENLEEITVNFLGYRGNPKPQELTGPYNDDPALNFAFYLRYNFGKLTFLKCDKPKK